MLALVEHGEAAASKLDLDEAETRVLIDQQLRGSGWEADTRTLRHSAGVRPANGRNMAIAEWQTANGERTCRSRPLRGLDADRIVEAKRRRKNVSCGSRSREPPAQVRGKATPLICSQSARVSSCTLAS